MFCMMLSISVVGEEQWKADSPRQTAFATQGGGTSGPYLLADGTATGHTRRVPPAPALPVSGEEATYFSLLMHSEWMIIS